MTDLHWWSAVDLAAAIRGRELSATEALEHLVARIERLDGPINAVVHWDLDRARTAAADATRAADRQRTMLDRPGPARPDRTGPRREEPDCADRRGEPVRW